MTAKAKTPEEPLPQLTETAFPVLAVMWDDAHCPAGSSWEIDLAALDHLVLKPVRVCSVGFLVKESETAIALAQSVSDENQADNVLRIPTSMIVSRTRLL